MNLDNKVTKYAFYGFNASYMIGCISILVFAGIVQYNIIYYNFFPESFPAHSILLLITSCLLILVSGLGYYGAIKKKPLLLHIFAGIIGVIAACQLIGGCLALSQEKALEVDMEIIMNNKLNEYKEIKNGNIGGSSAVDTIKLWDNMQRESSCCGVYNSSEWLSSPNALTSVPDSCTCKRESDNCQQGIYVRGCFPFFRDYMHNIEIILGCIAISFFALLLFSIGSAEVVARNSD